MSTVLITGCSRGIGRALVDHFIQREWSVFGCSRSDFELSDPRFCHFRLDLNDSCAVKRMLGDLRRREAGLDVLVNNAGRALMGPFSLVPPISARKVVDLNFNSVLELTHAAIRLLRRSDHPRIINLSSVAVPYRLEGEAVYAATKAAIEQWTRVIAHELGPLGITVNAIGPTPIRTDLIRGIGEEKLQQLIDRQAIPRWGALADVINLVEFFVRPQSNFVTGQVVYLGGAG